MSANMSLTQHLLLLFLSFCFSATKAADMMSPKRQQRGRLAMEQKPHRRLWYSSLYQDRRALAASMTANKRAVMNIATRKSLASSPNDPPLAGRPHSSMVSGSPQPVLSLYAESHDSRSKFMHFWLTEYTECRFFDSTLRG